MKRFALTLPMLAGLLAMPLAMASSFETTFLELLKLIQPGAPYSWLNPIIGLVFLSLVMTAIWHGPIVVGKITDALQNKGLSGLWVVPLLTITLFLTFCVHLFEAPGALVGAAPPEGLGVLALMLTLFSAGLAAHLDFSYPRLGAWFWRVLSLGLPKPVMMGFWSCVYFWSLAVITPTFATSGAAIMATGVFLSLVVFQLGAKWLARSDAVRLLGTRRIAVLSGHGALAVLCILGAEYHSYSDVLLSRSVELYLAGVSTFCWLTMCDDLASYRPTEHEWFPVLYEAPPVLANLLWVAAGIAMGLLGYTWAAWPMVVFGLLGARTSQVSLAHSRQAA